MLKSMLVPVAASRQLWAAGESEPKLAVLIAPPEAASRADVTALAEALNSRGFQSEEILCLMDAPFNRDRVLDCLAQARQRIAGWSRGSVFLAYSGHGSCWVSRGADAQAALALPGGDLLWADALAALQVPPAVGLTLLADC
jgi:hypothetical protein